MIAHTACLTFTGQQLKATPMEWGAWREWFKRKGLARCRHHMDKRGYYMTPAQWPHDFDAEADLLQSKQDGQNFFDAKLEKEKRDGEKVFNKKPLPKLQPRLM